MFSFIFSTVCPIVLLLLHNIAWFQQHAVHRDTIYCKCLTTDCLRGLCTVSCWLGKYRWTCWVNTAMIECSFQPWLLSRPNIESEGNFQLTWYHFSAQHSRCSLVSVLSAFDVLRKDLKVISGDKLKITISSVPCLIQVSSQIRIKIIFKYNIQIHTLLDKRWVSLNLKLDHI